MYKETVYGKFDQVPLASQGWKKKSSAGDNFVIHSFGKVKYFMTNFNH